MVIAIIEAEVHPNKWEAIKKAFKSEIGALKLFPIAEIFLIQDKADPTFWRILSIWYSLDDLKAAQNRGSLPGELIFVLVGASPVTSIFNVVAHAQRSLEDPPADKS
jgi:hypothetical protein